MGTEQRLDPVAQAGVAPAGVVQVRGTGGFVRLFGRFEEDLFDAIRVDRHGRSGLGFTHQCEKPTPIVSPNPEKSSSARFGSWRSASRSQARAYVQWR